MIILKIFTAFPDIFKNLSCLSKNTADFLENIQLIDLNKFGKFEKKIVGGGNMAFQYDNLIETLPYCKGKKICLSPDGIRLNQNILKELTSFKELDIFLFRYEGADIRFIEEQIDINISVGDFIISNGELASILFLDSLFRLLGTVKKHSLNDSFDDNLLDVDCYTKSKYRNDIPEILFSGNHKNIEDWKYKYKIFKTLFLRPDLLFNKIPLKKDYFILKEISSIISNILDSWNIKE